MRKPLKYTLVIAFAMICCMNAATADQGDTFTGMARVIDSDLLEVDGQRVILFGVDPMDRNQTCTIDGKVWNCWAVGARELQILVANEPVSCEDRGILDPFLRIYARCQIDDVDINEARNTPRGLWRGAFNKPWLFRLTVSGQDQPLRKPAKVPALVSTR